MDKQSREYKVATTGLGRVFVIPGGARFDREIHYASFMRVDTGSTPLGDITPIKINNPSQSNSYIEVGEIRGASGRVTTQIIQKMPLELISTVDRLARRGIKFDVHVQYGECYDPSDIRQFSKGRVYEYATGTSLDHDALVAIDDSEDAEIRETLAISAVKKYDYVPLAYREREPETVINEIIDVAIKLVRDCDDLVDKPLPMFAVTKAAGGSPGTGPYILWSLDDGSDWSSHEIDTLTDAQDPSGVEIANGYIFVISSDAGSYSFVELEDFYFPDEIGFDPDFTELTTGLSDNPLAISSTGREVFICGDAGYIYKISEPSEGAEVLDEAEASGGAQLNDIVAFNDKYIVAVGNAGTVIYATDGESFSAVQSAPVGVEVNINAVSARYKDEWWIGCDDGTVYVTFDSGEHWSQVTLPNQTAITAINSIAWASHSIGYISGVVGGNARVWRTVCGGIKWSVEPQQSRYSMPTVDRFNALAVSTEDVNIVLAGGLGDNATDGTLVVGNDAAT